MPTTKDEKNLNSIVTPGLLKSLFWNLAIPIIVGAIVLIIEYWSGLFQQLTQSNKSPHYHIAVLFIFVMLCVSMLFAKKSLLVWFHHHKYMREHFALSALCTAVSLCLVLLLSLYYGFMPWKIPEAIFLVLTNKPILKPDTKLIDYLFIIVFYGIILYILKQQHKSWRGLKSVNQYQREQRSETVGFIVEGFNELTRLIKREPPLRLYSEPSLKQFFSQLEPVTDSLAWKDIAIELILLSSGSYDFDLNTSWHDKEHCWVGQNVNTGDLVFVHPYQDEISEVKLKEFLKYAERITKSENRTTGEIIVAAKSKRQ